MVAEGLVPEAELGNGNQGRTPTEHLAPALTMPPPWWVADLGKPSFLLGLHFSSCPRKSKPRKVEP